MRPNSTSTVLPEDNRPPKQKAAHIISLLHDQLLSEKKLKATSEIRTRLKSFDFFINPNQSLQRLCLSSLCDVRKQGLMEVKLNNKKLYECDITRAQFEKILPILESAKNKTGPRTTDLYLVFCGILYLLKTGCQWRLIPKEYPDWKLLHYYFTIWNKE